jgi:hypothetical protein
MKPGLCYRIASNFQYALQCDEGVGLAFLRDGEGVEAEEQRW